MVAKACGDTSLYFAQYLFRVSKLSLLTLSCTNVLFCGSLFVKLLKIHLAISVFTHQSVCLLGTRHHVESGAFPPAERPRHPREKSDLGTEKPLNRLIQSPSVHHPATNVLRETQGTVMTATAF